MDSVSSISNAGLENRTLDVACLKSEESISKEFYDQWHGSFLHTQTLRDDVVSEPDDNKDIPILHKEPLLIDDIPKSQTGLKVLNFLDRLSYSPAVCSDIDDSATLKTALTKQERDQWCPVCSLPVGSKQESITCEMCLQKFCLDCSGLSKEIYDVMFAHAANPCVVWMCNICRPLFTSLAELTQKVDNYECIADARLCQLENKINTIKN